MLFTLFAITSWYLHLLNQPTEFMTQAYPVILLIFSLLQILTEMELPLQPTNQQRLPSQKFQHKRQSIQVENCRYSHKFKMPV